MITFKCDKCGTEDVCSGEDEPHGGVYVNEEWFGLCSKCLVSYEEFLNALNKKRDKQIKSFMEEK